MKSIRILVLLTLVAMSSCNKDEQEMIDQLGDYQWDVTDIQVNGKSVDIAGYIGGSPTYYYYNYASCDASNGVCSGTFTFDQLDDSSSVAVEQIRTFVYEFSDKQKNYTETTTFLGDGSTCTAGCETIYEVVKYRDGKIFCIEGPDGKGDEVLWTMKPID